MLIHPWDAGSDAEWRAWLSAGHDFGQLIAVDAQCQPIVVPTHFQFDGESTIRLHLARPNPIWPALELRGEATLSVLDEYAFIPSTWRAGEIRPVENGVPTSYYANVQLRCAARILDDPAEKAALLRQQLGHFQPTGDHGPVEADEGPYHRQLPGIRGIELTVNQVRAKFKYDDKKPELQTDIAAKLNQRGTGRDVSAAAQQLRRHNQNG
ncbi:MAG TPA: FMN-binding negative transcriptional regulator [Pseudonocardiaceae bacterium]|jgi:transcriptional regulator|nr:FMN-binding negative transcriptional regulator [Pseudonocardiaceae bacterium]